MSVALEIAALSLLTLVALIGGAIAFLFAITSKPGLRFMEWIFKADAEATE